MNDFNLIQLYKSIDNTRDAVLREIKNRNWPWEQLASYGLTVQATLAYREKYGVSLVDAKKAVDKLLQGKNTGGESTIVTQPLNEISV